MLAEIDNWDLSVHRREATLVQNRRKVALESLQDQPKPHTDKDGFFLHTRLGLVGWIIYWCNGDSALVVDAVVVLINMLDLKELVSVALTGTKYKETETNAKIVDVWG